MYDKDDMLKISRGNGPERALYEKVALTSCCIFPRVTGRDPSKVLLSTERCCNCVKFPNEDGIVPDKRLCSSVNSWSIFSLPMLSVMEPVNWLPESPNLYSLGKLPIPSGILPDILLNPILSILSCADRLVIELGNTPLKLLFCSATPRSLVQFAKSDEFPLLDAACCQLVSVEQ